jgi:hypothetical protein
VDDTVKTQLARLLASRADDRQGDRELMAFVAMHAVEAVLEAAVLHRPELLAEPALQSEVVQLTVKYLQVSENEQPAANVTKGSA